MTLRNILYITFGSNELKYIIKEVWYIMDKNKEEFNKIIYFDEDSAADLIYMCNQGVIEEEISSIKKSDEDINFNGKIEVGIKGIMKNLLGIGVNAAASGSMGASGEELLNRVIKNTILTDYLKLNLESNKIVIFDNSKVYPYENSLTYVKMITPYLIMTEGKLNAGELKINAPLMDQALITSKGYYEMILEDKDRKCILRFNIRSFRNSYLLTDLVKMNLTFHGIKVGQINLSNLDMEKEFDIKNNIQELDGYEEANKLSGKILRNDNEKDLDVYDVILAGVKK